MGYYNYRTELENNIQHSYSVNIKVECLAIFMGFWVMSRGRGIEINIFLY